MCACGKIVLPNTLAFELVYIFLVSIKSFDRIYRIYRIGLDRILSILFILSEIYIFLKIK